MNFDEYMKNVFDADKRLTSGKEGKKRLKKLKKKPHNTLKVPIMQLARKR